MRILCEVFGLFDKRGASEGGTHYIIRGAWGLGAYKGAAERRLTGGRKYAPKGNGKDEKEKKEPAKGKRKREKERKGRKEDHLRVGANMRPKETGKMKRRKKSVQKEKEREKRREKGERMIKSKPKEDERKMEG